MLGEEEDRLWEVANEMDREDGLIWVYWPGDDGVMAFTDFGGSRRLCAAAGRRTRGYQTIDQHPCATLRGSRWWGAPSS
jgi:hypothetical protein